MVMKRRFPALLLTAALMLCCVAPGCSKGVPNPAATATAVAQQEKLEALQPRLDQLATEQPKLADEVKDVTGQWATRPEPETYARVKPLIEQYLAAHPDDAEGTNRVMESWRRRLDQTSK
jgi:cell division protein FtsB